MEDYQLLYKPGDLMLSPMSIFGSKKQEEGVRPFFSVGNQKEKDNILFGSWLLIFNCSAPKIPCKYNQIGKMFS